MQTTTFMLRASEIAREAGALLLPYFKRRIGFEYKGDVDLVTEADCASEKLIVSRIKAQWPSHDIMGEEGTRHDAGGEYKWYVDPLDGTTNFAHGFPVFCVSMGLEYKGELVLGVIYDPTRDELFSAEKGGGAYLNGERMNVSKTTRLCESLVGTGFPSHKRHKNPNIYFYHTITLRSHGVRRAGSAALDLANVASGRLDGFWEFNLNPWDTSAGAVLVREAGGMVTGFDGSPFQLNSREVLGSNGIIHQELMEIMADVFAGRNLEALPRPEEWKR